MPFLGFRFHSSSSITAHHFTTFAIRGAGHRVGFGQSADDDLPSELGQVVAVAARACAVKVSGELVGFGGRCDVPPDLGPVVAVAAGLDHTCAVKASGELVCFGNNGG